MWTYILRRLLVMIPTLLGVTIVSFCVMQLAPGDPLMNQLGAGGMAGQSTQTRDAYLIQKRDLKLDKPLVLNFNYFRDYTETIRLAAHYMGRSEQQIAEGFSCLVPAEKRKSGSTKPDMDRLSEPEIAARLRFLRRLKIDNLQEQLEDPQQYARLAHAVVGLAEIFCEDTGAHGVPAAMAILRSDGAPLTEKIGAIRCLRRMAVDPLVYSYSRHPSAADTPQIVEVWRRWWELAQQKDKNLLGEGRAAEFPDLTPHRRKALQQRFAGIMAAESRMEMFDRLEYFDPDELRPFHKADMRFFVEKLLGQPIFEQQVVAAVALGGHIGQPLDMDVPLGAGADLVRQVSENWFLHFKYHRSKYEPGLAARTWYIVADTQYANLVARLLTFNFGRSALRTREPVGQKIWEAVIVSAPLMIMAQLVIYFVAVPLGILCAVNRAGWTDRLISFGLFLLYSIPPFVAGMMFLLLFCYGDYLRLFPMDGLHSDWAEDFGFARYVLDYLHHAVLPVMCLSLFSLAAMAMYSRTAMLDVIGQDYIRTARAKGLSETKVIMKHGLRNSLIPIVTLFANFLPAMLGGSVLIEVIFGVPGMGRLGWLSIEQKDFPTLMALIYINAIVVMLSILLTDMLYVLIDPRISFEGRGRSA